MQSNPLARAYIYKGIEYEKTRRQEYRNTRIRVYDDGDEKVLLND